MFFPLRFQAATFLFQISSGERRLRFRFLGGGSGEALASLGRLGRA
jgi:hypothetical protein